MPTTYEADNVIKIIRKDQIDQVGNGEIAVIIDEDQIIDEAPKDGKEYVRKDASWVELKKSDCSEWKPNLTWWNIKKELSDDLVAREQYSNAYICLCKNNLENFTFKIDGINCATVITSDGAVYNEIGTFTHTWTGINDKDCLLFEEVAYKTRWYKVYVNQKDDYSLIDAKSTQVIGYCFSGVGGTSHLFGSQNVYQSSNGLIFIQSLNDKWIGSRTSCDYMFCNCHSLCFVESFDSTKITTAKQSFYKCYSLKKIPELDLSNSEDLQSFCADCYSLNYPITLLTSEKLTNLNGFLENSLFVPKIILGDVSGLDYNLNYLLFYNTPMLSSIKVKKDSIKNNILSGGFSNHSSLLTTESLVSLLLGCAEETDREKVLTLGEKNLNNLLIKKEENEELKAAYSQANEVRGWVFN